jgi:hypothetical protein
MVVFVLAMTLAPAAQSILETTGPSDLQWIMVVAGAVLASMWMEVVKWVVPTVKVL